LLIPHDLLMRVKHSSAHQKAPHKAGLFHGQRTETIDNYD
jgi:hypothetical protein